MVETSPGALPPQTHTLPVKERIALGRALRERAARKHHGAWKPSSNRRDPIEILIEQGESRLPDLQQQEEPSRLGPALPRPENPDPEAP